jgi:hypothetical protein
MNNKLGGGGCSHPFLGKWNDTANRLFVDPRRRPALFMVRAGNLPLGYEVVP